MSNKHQFTVRLARREELEQIAKVNQRAYINSPVQNYLAGLSSPLTTEPKDAKHRQNQENYLKFQYRRAWNSDARVIVVVSPSPSSDSPEKEKERIVGCSVWSPPKSQRTRTRSGSGYDVFKLLPAGLLGVVRGWGLGFVRKALGMQSTIHESIDRVFKEMNISEETQATEVWTLEFVAVDSEFQGKGLMSLMFRDAFEHAPSAVYILYASTAAARDRYARWGFEMVKEVIIGKGECDVAGLMSSGSGSGFSLYCMVRKSVPA